MHVKKSLILFTAVVAILAMVIFIACSGSGGEKKSAALEVTSSAFGHAKSMSDKFTCDDVDISPPLEWKNVPAGTKAFAIICETPDAPQGNWVQWLVYDIPASVTSLPQALPRTGQLEDGAKQGKNDFDGIGYNGPCLPAGEHRFFFRVYALDAPTNLKEGAKKEDLVQAMKDHILAEGALMGVYSRE
ncbi:MAG TPA: YbhB/YbcL family Raf kinase inhibitor-like protein [Syntrophales bacterium]|nr:YbhB/YbcL family Raf kinase inhibitor-like protein [Syntrophales bacterium]